MSDWSPEQYLRFKRERTRAAADLLAQIDIAAPGHVVDLGCGPGNSTELLVERWPEARVEGFDSSPSMLASARRLLPGVRFFEADAALWEPAGSEDVLFANALFQWLPDHLDILARLLGRLRPGAALAVQMPNNLDEPSHALMREAAAAGPWSAKITAARIALPPAGTYYERLLPLGRVDLWRTTYFHQVDGIAGIVEWVKATGLRPYLDPLDPTEAAGFLDAYRRRLETAYAVQSDGTVLLPFPRFFLVAVRA